MKLLEVMGDDEMQEQAFAPANDVLKNAVGYDITTSATSATSSTSAMNTIRRCAADDRHVIFGTACARTLADQLRVTVIATGLSSSR